MCANDMITLPLQASPADSGITSDRFDTALHSSAVSHNANEPVYLERAHMLDNDAMHLLR